MTTALKPPHPSIAMNSPGPKPKLEWLRLDQLVVDPAYQRPTDSRASRKNLEYMRQHFSWAHCGTLMVCPLPKTGTYAVIDGQHRLEAARARGDIDMLPCAVMTGREFRQQAESFVIVNTRRVNMNSVAKFHGAAAAGDPAAVELLQFLKECNIEIPLKAMDGQQVGPRQTQAVSSLLKLMKSHGRDQLKWALNIIPQAYGEKKGMLQANLIKAMASFARELPEAMADSPRVATVLGKLTPEELEHSAREYVKIEGGRTSSAMVRALMRHYKTGARGQRVVDDADAARERKIKADTSAGAYIGKRDDHRLVDEDWGTIKAILERGGLPMTIAKSHGWDAKELEQFIREKQAEEKLVECMNNRKSGKS